MSVDPNELLGLPHSELLRLVELLWDNLGEVTEPIPLPDWVEAEGLRRRQEMEINPALGLNHDAIWSKIDRRN